MSGGFKGHRPSGQTFWPIVLVAGAEKTGKSYAVAELTGSDLIGETFWIELGETTAEEYGAVPGARYIVAEHDGSFNDICRRAREAVAEPTRDGKPNLIVIDSMTLIWEMLSAEVQEIANRRKKADIDAESKVTNDLWNLAKARWKKLMRILRSHNGPVVLVARLEVVAVMDASGQPTKDKTRKVQAHKSLPYDVGVIVQVPEYRKFQITGVRSLVFNMPPGETFDAPPDFTLDSLLRRMGLAELGVVEAPKFVEPAPSAQDAMAEAGGEPQERPAQRERGQSADEWSTPEPSPMVPTATGVQIDAIAELLKAKRTPDQTAWNQIISNLLRRHIDNVRTITQAEARGVMETLAGEPDLAASPASPAGPPPVGTPTNPTITGPQQKMMHALLKEKGLSDRDKGLAFMSRVTCRAITSSADLSSREATAVIEALKTGEIPAPSPSDEGFDVFTVLDEMIAQVVNETTFREAQQAIDAEQQRGEISADDAQILRERLAQVTGAVAAA